MQEWNTPQYRADMEAGYERIRAKHPALLTRRFECLAGWHGLLEEYFDEVARLVVAHPGATFSLWQVKEKFAGLRIYAAMSTNISVGVHAAEAAAEDAAERTCEICGRPGGLRQRGHWYMTRCDVHADGGTPVPDGEQA